MSQPSISRRVWCNVIQRQLAVCTGALSGATRCQWTGPVKERMQQDQETRRQAMGVNAEAGLVISRAASIGALEREQVGLTLKGDLSVEDEKETSHPTWRSRSLGRERTVVLAFERHLAQKRRGAREGSVGWACRAIPMHIVRLPFRGMPSPRVDLWVAPPPMSHRTGNSISP